jgi:thiosulfate/3-mercaptopyruvate sulfurtransferase
MKTLILGIAILFTAALAADLVTIEPNNLAGQLAAKRTHPTIIQVGPNVLFRSKHIPGAIYGGAAGKPEGIDQLKKAVSGLPLDAEIIIYCGCCPWASCPNVKPALAQLQQLGYRQVKILHVETGFAQDWADKGYPVIGSTVRP